MKKLFLLFLCASLVVAAATGCTTMKQVQFPPSNEVFITTGDGDITKPYRPIGQLIYKKEGFRFGFFLLGFIPISDVAPEEDLRGIIAQKAREMGGDAVINLKIKWNPASSGFLGFLAHGGSIVVDGTVIKR